MRLRRVAQSIVEVVASRSQQCAGVGNISSGCAASPIQSPSPFRAVALLLGGHDARSVATCSGGGGLQAARAAAAVVAGPSLLHRHFATRALLASEASCLWPRQQQHLILACRPPPLFPPSLVAAAAPGLQQQQQQQQQQQRRQQHSNAHRGNRRSIADNGLYLGAVALGMLALSYLSVPLYRMFCQATGYGGALGREAAGVEDKLRRRREAPDPDLEAKAAARELRVWFSADVADGVPWRFTPTQEFVRVRPGESTLAFFTAENLSDKPVTGVSTYNVVPEKAALYFNKVQCFCFEEQRLRPREAVDMPVFFYIDPELAGDWNCRNIHDITLSYTFYRVDDEGDDDDEGGADDDKGGSGGGGGPRVHTWTSGPLPANIKVPEGLALPPGVTREGDGGSSESSGGGEAGKSSSGGGGGGGSASSGESDGSSSGSEKK